MVLSSAIVCDHDRRSMFPYDRRRSQTLLRSAICDSRSYGDQPLCSIFCDRLRSSAIMIAGSQTTAEVCFHMIADDRRRSQTLLRSAICDPRSYGNQPLIRDFGKSMYAKNWGYDVFVRPSGVRTSAHPCKPL